MKKRIISLLLAIVMITAFLSACGEKDAGTVTESLTENEATIDNETSGKADQSTIDGSSGEKRKIVIVKESTDQTRLDTQNNIIAGLEAGGYINGNNAEILDLTMDANDVTGEKVVNPNQGNKA